MESIRIESNFLFRDNYELRSFRLGAAHRLCHRAHFLREEENAPAKPANGTAMLVLRNKLEKANKDYMAKLGLGKFYSKGSSADSNAYGLGEAFGESIDLNRNPRTRAITMR